MSSTLLAPPISHDLPELRRESQRLSDDTTMTKIKSEGKIERFCFKLMMGGGEAKKNKQIKLQF